MKSNGVIQLRLRVIHLTEQPHGQRRAQRHLFQCGQQTAALGIHVIDGGHARPRHFTKRKLRAALHAVRRQSGLHRKDAGIEPGLQLQIVCRGAEQHHGQVRMSVDEAGHQHLSALAVNHARAGFVLRLRAHIGDPAVLHAHGGVFQHAHLLIHRHNPHVFEQRIHPLGHPFVSRRESQIRSRDRRWRSTWSR